MAQPPAPMPAVHGAPPAVPPRPDGPPAWPLADWGLDELLPMLLVPFGIVLLAQELVVGFFGWTSDGARVLLSLVQQLALLLPLVVWVRRTRGSLAPLGLRRGWTGRDVAAGVGGGLVAIVAGVIVIGLTLSVVEALTGHRPDVTSGLRSVAGPWVFAEALLAVVFAPLCEETFFRGFLFGGLRRRWRLVPAALVSGAFFGFAHVEPIRFVGLATMGAILAVIFERRRTLTASIAAHATINVLAVLALLLAR